jgi:hypothetical protein
MSPPARASGAPNVVGRLARKTSGHVIAGISGTPSIPGVSAHHAFVSGL